MILTQHCWLTWILHFVTPTVHFCCDATFHSNTRKGWKTWHIILLECSVVSNDMTGGRIGLIDLSLGVRRWWLTSVIHQVRLLVKWSDVDGLRWNTIQSWNWVESELNLISRIKIELNSSIPSASASFFSRMLRRVRRMTGTATMETSTYQMMAVTPLDPPSSSIAPLSCRENATYVR